MLYYILEYFWRDYYGKIPEDAFPGIDGPQGRLYIGQGYVAPFGLLPSVIYPGCRTALAASFVKEIRVNNMGIKVKEEDEGLRFLAWVQGISKTTWTWWCPTEVTFKIPSFRRFCVQTIHHFTPGLTLTLQEPETAS